jgi:hypothetical protein
MTTVPHTPDATRKFLSRMERKARVKLFFLGIVRFFGSPIRRKNARPSMPSPTPIPRIGVDIEKGVVYEIDSPRGKFLKTRVI